MTGKDDSGHEGGDGTPGAETSRTVPSASAFPNLEIPAVKRRNRRNRAGRVVIYTTSAAAFFLGGAIVQYDMNSRGYTTPIDEIAEVISEYRTGLNTGSDNSETKTQPSQLEKTTEGVSVHSTPSPVTYDGATVKDLKTYSALPSTDDILTGYYNSAYANKNLVLGENDEHTLGALADKFLESFDAYVVSEYGQMPTSELKGHAKTSTMHVFSQAVISAGYVVKQEGGDPLADTHILNSKRKETKEVLLELQ